MMDLIDGQKADAVVISALPPQAAAHARYLVKRLLSRHPDLMVVLGLWMDFRADKVSRTAVGSTKPVARLEQALAQMEQISHLILIKANQPETQESRQLAEQPT
jgi:hypothetical protein